MFNELNTQHVATVKEGIDTDSMEFKPLADFEGQTVKVDGFFFTRSKKYNVDQVVVVGNGYKINMPARAVDVFKSIRDNENMLKVKTEEGRNKIIEVIDMVFDESNNKNFFAYPIPLLY